MYCIVIIGGDFQLYFVLWCIKFYVECFIVFNFDWVSWLILFQVDKFDIWIVLLLLIFGKWWFYWFDLVNGVVDLEWNVVYIVNIWMFFDKKGGKLLVFLWIDVVMVMGMMVCYFDFRMCVLVDLKLVDIYLVDVIIGWVVGLKGIGWFCEMLFMVIVQLLLLDVIVNCGQNMFVVWMWVVGNVIDVVGMLLSIVDVEDVLLMVIVWGVNFLMLFDVIDVVILNICIYCLCGQMVKYGDEFCFMWFKGIVGNIDVVGMLMIVNGECIYFDLVLMIRSFDIVDVVLFIGYNFDIVEMKGVVVVVVVIGVVLQCLLFDVVLLIKMMQLFDVDLKWMIGVVKLRNILILNVDLMFDLECGWLVLLLLIFVMVCGNVVLDVIFDMCQWFSVVFYDICFVLILMGWLLKGYGFVELGMIGVIKGCIKLDGCGDLIYDLFSIVWGWIVFVMLLGVLLVCNVQLVEFDIGIFVQWMFQGKFDELVQVNCGLIGFIVCGGVVVVDLILIDMWKNVIVGCGGFSFCNEVVDLVFCVDLKKFSLFVGQLLVGVGGMFVVLKFNVILKDLLEWVGGGLGFVLVVMLVVGILVFVDVGDVKLIVCGLVLVGVIVVVQCMIKGQLCDDVGYGMIVKVEDGKVLVVEKFGQWKKFLGIF